MGNETGSGIEEFIENDRQEKDYRQLEFIVVSGANYRVPRSERGGENDDDSDDGWPDGAVGRGYRH